MDEDLGTVDYVDSISHCRDILKKIYKDVLMRDYIRIAVAPSCMRDEFGQHRHK